jgi:diguanylate cyclase (GGDEF)-like protein
MKVLIVDDSSASLLVAEARLAKENVDIFCASGAQTGLELARREMPDLILLDVDMPEMSGFDLCRLMKSDPDLHMIPIIFLSGSGTAQDKVYGLDLGAVDYVTKPFDAYELQARVRAALRTKQLQDLLLEHAHLDPLTSLPNRRALAEGLEREWARVERNGFNLSLIIADIDHFKRINDNYGHSIGDRMLQQVAKVIKAQCRRNDLPARYGGEEFAILLPDANMSGAFHMAERCRQEVEAIRLTVGDISIRTTASFGLATYLQATSIQALLDAADAALYEAKQAGRNTVCIAGDVAPPVAPPVKLDDRTGALA